MSNEGDKLDQTTTLEEQNLEALSGSDVSGAVHSSPSVELQPDETVIEDYEKNVARIFKEQKKEEDSVPNAERVREQNIEEGAEVRETAQEGEGRVVEPDTKTAKASSNLSWPLTGDQMKWGALGLLSLIIVVLFAIATIQRAKSGKGAGHDDSVIDIIEDNKPSHANIFQNAPLTSPTPIPPQDIRPVVNFTPGQRAMLGGVMEVGGSGFDLESIKSSLTKYMMPLLFLIPTLSSSLGPQLSSLGGWNIGLVLGGIIGIYLLKSKWPKGPDNEGAFSYIQFILYRILWVVIALSLLGTALTGVARILPNGTFDKGLTLAQSYFPVVSSFFLTLWQQRIVPFFVF
jgi:hypothetical protein